MAKTANEQYLDAQIRHQVYLLRYSGSVRNRVTALLGRVEDDMAAKIYSKLETAPPGLTTPRDWERMYSLHEAVNGIRSGAWANVQGLLADELTALAVAEAASVDNMIKTILPVLLETTMPAARLLKSIALSRPFQGRILKDWASQMEATDLALINNSIQLGMTAGETNKQIIKRIFGTAAAKGADGVLEMTRSNVDAVVRTAVQHVANSARAEFFNQNADIIDLEQFVATLDSRTTPVCRAEDGKQYPLNKGPRPPLHMRCRSLRVIVFDGQVIGDRPAKPTTEKMLLNEYSEKNGLGKLRSRDDLPRGKKGDYDKFKRQRIRELTGPIPAAQSYNTWLKDQPVAFQNEVLGVTKAKLYRDGGLQLDKFVDRNGAELTLSDLAVKEKEAFRSAGLNPDDYT